MIRTALKRGIPTHICIFLEELFYVVVVLWFVWVANFNADALMQAISSRRLIIGVYS